MSLPHPHCILVPLMLRYGYPEAARRLITSLICCCVSSLSWPYLALGLPSYLMLAHSIRSPHRSPMFSLILPYPSFSPNVLVMISVRPDFVNHRWAIFMGLLRVIALRASILCCWSAYRSIGGMPISVSISRLGVFVSSPQLLLMILGRVACASCIRPLVFHSSMPYLSCASTNPEMSR